MFSHVMVGADDMDSARRFYDAVLGTLGVGAGTEDDKGRLWYQTQRGTFAVTRPLNGAPASCANGGTIGFLARTPCRLVAVQAEDILGLEEQANLPGTTVEHPNWRRRLPLQPRKPLPSRNSRPRGSKMPMSTVLPAPCPKSPITGSL